MTNTGRLQPAHSPNSAAPPSYPAQDLSIRDILERWVGTDETLRAALTAHSSSSHRRAEEERTRQEYYRLETRRVEYELLREAFRGGIHPSLIPQLFTTQDRSGTQNLSPVSPIQRQEERPLYPTSSLPSYNRHDLPRIDTSNLPPPGNRSHLVAHREKYAGPISAPPASMATTSPPPSIFFRHWAPPPRTAEEVGIRTSRDDIEHRYHHPDQQIPSPSSSRKTPPLHNGISPKRSTHGNSHSRQRSEAAISGKMHDSRHHPYPSRIQSRKHDDEAPGLGATKSPLDRETVMRALREKVAPRKEDEDLEKRDSERREPDKRDSDKKEVEKKRGDSATRGDVMALEQLVESNGAPPQQV
jgi:hypothetical protein